MAYRKRLNKSLKDLPKDLLPREKLLKLGPQSLDDAELWAVVLGSGTKGFNVLEVGRKIASLLEEEFENLSVERLLKVPGLGKVKALTVLSVVELCRRYSQKGNRPKIDSPEKVVEMVSPLIKGKKERLFVLVLSLNQKLLSVELVAVGGLNVVNASPREIFIPVLAKGGYFYILVHNHPDGEAKPSAEDIRFTNRVREAGQLLGLEMLDHIILGERDYFSFRANKLIEG